MSLHAGIPSSPHSCYHPSMRIRDLIALAALARARNAELIRQIDATLKYCDKSDRRIDALNAWTREHGYPVTPSPTPAPPPTE